MAGSDTVIHLATRIPPVAKMGRLAAWAENDRIRRDGTRNLVDAALATGVATLVYESIVLVYADAGDRWLDAETGEIDPPAHVRSTVDAEREVARFTAGGGRGLSLRLGLLYSPGDKATASQRTLARMGIAAVMGPRDGYWPMLWIDDAAAAFVAAAERAPAGVFDVVDDRPVTRGELTRAMSEAAGRRLWRLPEFVQRLMVPQTLDALVRSQRVSNRRFVAAAGWRPRVPDAFEGWRRIMTGPMPAGAPAAGAAH